MSVKQPPKGTVGSIPTGRTSMKFHYIYIPIWGIKLILAIGDKDIEQQLVKEAKKQKLSDKLISDILLDRLSYDRTAGACYFCDSEAKAIMWLPHNKYDDSTLQHEIVHLVDYILMYIGATTEMEARAYTHNYIYDTLTDWLKQEQKIEKEALK